VGRHGLHWPASAAAPPPPPAAAPAPALPEVADWGTHLQAVQAVHGYGNCKSALLSTDRPLRAHDCQGCGLLSPKPR
jgi:hypothetical protein